MSLYLLKGRHLRMRISHWMRMLCAVSSWPLEGIPGILQLGSSSHFSLQLTAGSDTGNHGGVGLWWLHTTAALLSHRIIPTLVSSIFAENLSHSQLQRELDEKHLLYCWEVQDGSHEPQLYWVSEMWTELRECHVSVFTLGALAFHVTEKKNKKSWPNPTSWSFSPIFF